MRFEQQISACLKPAAAAALAVSLFASDRVVFASEQVPATPPVTQQPVPPLPQQPAAPGVMRIGSDEAVRMALENNLGLQTERLSPEIQALGITRALGAYKPLLFATTSRSSNTSPPRDFLSTGVAVTTSASFITNTGVQQQLPWGGFYSLSLSGSRGTSDAPRVVFSPALGSDLNAQYDQPLLRNFSIDGFRQALLQSRNARQIADLQLQERVTQTSRAVRSAYYDLVGAITGLQVAQQSLELAQQSLRNNKRRVEVGTMAPIDIVEAEAEVARNEENVIQRESAIQGAEDRLRALIMNPTQPDFWSAKLEPAEQPTLTPQTIDVQAAVANALANRTDLGRVKKQLESADIDIKYARNQKLPAVDLRARYGLTGVGGTQFDYGQGGVDGAPPIPIGSSQRSFADVLRDVFGNEFRNWSLSLQVSYPIGTSTADAILAQGRLQRQQGVVALRDLELQVATAVRDAGRQVNTDLKRVEATRKARELAERRLEAEEKRLAVGLSDTFRLFQAQRDLALQRQAELNAIIDYNRSLVDFQAVQSVPLR
ncbi:MAG: TolC family protein [Acidobacteria bacterium]|nr:TolC family protein [Acidobacteriota bacterium]MCA1649232.1 TolC family protein [Acidobacteriota bacterium]